MMNDYAELNVALRLFFDCDVVGGAQISEGAG